MLRNIGWVALALLLNGCDDYADCLGITLQLEPAEASLAVGESFTARAYERSCDGGRLGEREARWSATDTSVVRVDSVSGRVTAVGVGIAEVIATQDLVHLGEIAVEVAEP